MMYEELLQNLNPGVVEFVVSSSENTSITQFRSNSHAHI